MATDASTYLGHDLSDESDVGGGYDSDAAEISKSARLSIARPSKRRKLSHSSEEDIDIAGTGGDGSKHEGDIDSVALGHVDSASVSDERVSQQRPPTGLSSEQQLPRTAPTRKKKQKELKPGVIYMSSLPPYMKPSALRNALEQRGFGPIKRIFLAPSSKAKAGSKKNSRQLYAEGWIEFDSKKKARLCAEALNATPVGGKKGGFYHDDIWNMKYLKGMGWSELMAGVREERREEEGRRDEERRTIARETKIFVEGVEEGKRLQGMKKKRRIKSADNSENVDEVKRTWQQFEVAGSRKEISKPEHHHDPQPEVNRIVSKIF